MRSMVAVVLGLVIAGLMLIVPLGYERTRERQFRNFRVVQEGVLYRSGQLPLPQLQQVVAQYGIRSVVSLRDGSQAVDEQEEKWVQAKALNFVRIPYRDWNLDPLGNAPADASVKEFRNVMDDPKNYPVLVHCFAGIHRTGTMCAIFRMDYQGWTNLQAMNEMRANGYTILDEHDDIRTYLARYRSRRSERSVPALPTSFSKNPRP